MRVAYGSVASDSEGDVGNLGRQLHEHIERCACVDALGRHRGASVCTCSVYTCAYVCICAASGLPRDMMRE